MTDDTATLPAVPRAGELYLTCACGQVMYLPALGEWGECEHCHRWLRVQATVEVVQP